MIEGWHGEDYLVLFAESEIDPAGDRYEVSRQLPGLKLAGLRSRDDFVVQDPKGHTFSVPTVPFDQKVLEPFSVLGTNLKPDPSFVAKIKWHQTPLVFGGDPNLKENCDWLSHEQHAQPVRFWNDKYRTHKHNG